MNRLSSSLLLLILVLIGFANSGHAQTLDGVKSYAVIGVFSFERNADRFSDYYKSQSLDAKVRKNIFNNMFYVYAYESTDVEEVRQRVFDLRGQFNNLSKAWLYNGNFNCLHIPSDQLKGIASNNSNGIEELVENVEEAELEREQRQAREAEEAQSKIEEEKKKEPKVVKPADKYWVYFNTYNVTDLTEVEGNVNVVDLERNKDLGPEKSLQLVTLSSPNNGTNRVQFATDIFGYRIEKVNIDLDEPLAEGNEAVTVIGDSIIIDFPLRRYNKGDFMTMWNVYFYIDAAIMKEESVLELNQLLAMMREDEDVRIKIHGHTNGNSHGVVKHLDLDDKSFFSLNGSHLETKASAKKLSEYRAYTIQHWLMDQGIAEDRMEIVGWGGKKMLYDKHGANADKNVRVEIEILEE
ncbi:OmpA family protein [Fulvivirga lutimaris]|uniref:OmpA family protein n=1 Tax=Fulvivirga lutimaris TaxID=1819566 RepID=UPI0012BC0D0A|nr:OmpA family protein [Fulvivirga lutimaris]MTI40265.1 OmpA family protein [Fulvivirga lutimaris]